MTKFYLENFSLENMLVYLKDYSILESLAFKIEDSSCWHASASDCQNILTLYIPIIVDLRDTFSQQKARTRPSKGRFLRRVYRRSRFGAPSLFWSPKCSGPKTLRFSILR